MNEPETDAGLDRLQETDFIPRLNETFRILGPSGEALEARLVEVAPHPVEAGHGGRRRGFSIVLRTAAARHLPQAIYRVEHEEMGTMDLFLVPIGPRDGGMCYEAVFN